MIRTDRNRPILARYAIAIVIVGSIAVLLAGFGYWSLNRVAAPIKPLVNTLTFAGADGRIGEPFGIAIKGRDTYVSDGENGVIWKVADDGSATKFAEGLNTPSGIAFDPKGDLIVADSGSNTIRSVNSSGTVSTIAGVDGHSGYLDGRTASALFNAPIGVAIASDGRIFVADTYNDKIRVIVNGGVETVAGSTRGFADGPDAKFDTPCGIAVVGDQLLIADMGNHRIRAAAIDAEKNSSITTLAGDGSSELRDGTLGSASLVAPIAIAADSSGSVYVADGDAIRVIRGGALPLLTTVAGKWRGLRDGSPMAARFNRPSGIALDQSGQLLVTDSENRVIRMVTAETFGKPISPEQILSLSGDPANFRAAGPPRWPYDPPNAKRDIAGTLGEIRGEMKPGNDDIHFHNGLDIAGSYGEIARFVRDEKVLRPLATENFGTLRELIRMPTMGYIHIRLGRNAAGIPFGDPRFLYSTDPLGKITDVRVPRGSYFRAGEPIGTLNPMNHVHLIAGRSGSEMNALDALVLPGITDSRPPIIEKVTLADQSWNALEPKPGNGRITINGKTRIIVRAFDQVDGNSDRRRLGVYQVGYQLLTKDLRPITDPQWTIRFDRLPASSSIGLVYANGSKSGATGETIFNYIASNRVDGDIYREDFLDASTLNAGEYILRSLAADYFGNIAHIDTPVEIVK
ncbi:MAG: hypothetical protein ABJA02_16605 [Acidobacteriota bacterium]